MAKYSKLVQDILQAIGGKDNIAEASHCMTRLRLVLKDEKKADDAKVKNIDGVLQLVKAQGQYQIVIGSHVNFVYEELCAETGMSASTEGTKEEAGQKEGSLLDRFMRFISGIIFPVTYVMCACAIINGINILLRYTGVLTPDNGLYILLSGIGNAVLYLLPVFLGYTTAKQMKIDPFIGIGIGAAMCNPNINGVLMNILGFEIQATYTSTVLPVIIIVALASPLVKFLNRKVPAVLRGFGVPCITFLVAIPLGFCIIGPAVNLFGEAMGAVLNGLIDLNRVIAGFLIAGLWNISVVLGIQGVISMPSLTNVMAGVPDSFGAMRSGVCFAMAATALAVFVKTKNLRMKNVSLPAFVSGMFGVTEPALYGVAVPNMKVFVGTLISSGLGGAVAGLLGAMAYGVGSGGVFQVVGYINPADPSGSLFAIMANYVVSFVAGFVITWFLYKDTDEVSTTLDSFKGVQKYNAKQEAKAQDKLISSPIEGKAIPLSEVSDPAFATGTLGKGIAVIPDKGEVVAPFDCTVTALFNTKHAIGLTSTDGLEMLIHIGMDTVKLEGKYFTAHVKQGDVVKKGTLLITFDMDAIRKEGYSLETPVVITNTDDYQDVLPEQAEKVRATDNLLVVMA